jgi:hypothetical protein
MLYRAVQRYALSLKPPNIMLLKNSMHLTHLVYLTACKFFYGACKFPKVACKFPKVTCKFPKVAK